MSGWGSRPDAATRPQYVCEICGSKRTKPHRAQHMRLHEQGIIDAAPDTDRASKYPCGHPRTPENTEVRNAGSGTSRCRQCVQARARRKEERAKRLRKGRFSLTVEQLRTVNPEKFWAKVEKTDGCWNWTGRLSSGYGHVFVNATRTSTGAHRVAWALSGRDLDISLSLDHLCRNTRCVNPDHLEPVTLAENVRRAWEARR